jgi:hypothetical protein
VIYRGRFVVAMCAFIGVLWTSSATAQVSLPRQSHWAWIYTAALFDKWESITGKATVTIEGTKFNARLFDGEHPTLVQFTLSGTINGDQVKVRAVREQSDTSPGDYSGRIVTRNFTEFRDYSGAQTIAL